MARTVSSFTVAADGKGDYLLNFEDEDGEITQFGLQLAWPGLAIFPMLPSTSVPIGKDADGLPIGVQVIADTNQDFTAIAVARAAHELMQQDFRSC